MSLDSLQVNWQVVFEILLKYFHGFPSNSLKHILRTLSVQGNSTWICGIDIEILTTFQMKNI